MAIGRARARSYKRLCQIAVETMQEKRRRYFGDSVMLDRFDNPMNRSARKKIDELDEAIEYFRREIDEA